LCKGSHKERRQGGELSARDAEARSSDTLPGTDLATPLANVGPTTLGDTTTDAVNRNPSPQTTLAERQLKRFTERIQKPRQPPLLELPIEDKTYGRYAPPSFLM
jgi:hypothetical protein